MLLCQLSDLILLISGELCCSGHTKYKQRHQLFITRQHIIVVYSSCKKKTFKNRGKNLKMRLATSEGMTPQ